MKILAIIGLLFFDYCWLNVMVKRRFYSGIHMTIWLIVIGLGGWWCIATLLR
jgi:hypothetical protein